MAARGEGETGRLATARERLESELRRALGQAGIQDDAVRSVMEAGCRLDGIGAGAVPDHLERAGQRLEARVRALAAALDRLGSGTYGICEACGGAISDDRLVVLPATRRCRGCAG